MSLVPALLRTSSPPTGDQAHYLMDTISLATDGDLDVANNYARHDEDWFYARAFRPRGYTGQSAPYPLPPDPIASPARPSTEAYSYHPPGLGLLLVPAWIVGSWWQLAWPATVVCMCFVGALLALNVFLLAFEATSDFRIGWTVWAAMAFSAPLMCYSILIFSEVPSSLLILYAFRRLRAGWEKNRAWQLVLVGACIALVPWLSWRCGAIATGLALYGAARWWSCRRSEGSIRRSPALLAVPLALSAAAISLYGRFLSGTWLPEIRRRAGEADVFNWPWHGGRDFRLFVEGALALLFDQQWGLLVHSPVYVLGFVGLLAMLRRGDSAEREQMCWLGLLALPYLVLIAAFKHWGGLWCPPGRYLVPLVPLLALPLAHSLRVLGAVRTYRVVFLLFATLGFTYMALVSLDLHLLWPASRGFFWGWLSSHLPGQFDPRDMLPAFAWPDDRHPIKVGWLLAGTSALVLGFDCWLMRKGPRRFWRSGLVWTTALAALGACWFLVSGELLGSPRLVFLRRWELTPPPLQPEGMTFFDAKLFVADYRGGAVWLLDLETGAWGKLLPHSEERALDFFHPGEVKANRGGLLFVLNNGPGSSALFVMRRDGEVVRQIALAGHTGIATGLAFGGAGLYVADMRGGRIREYRARGGEPIRSWPDSGLNNVAGLALSGDGTLFAAESSAGRVLQYDVQGRLLRGFEVGCNPRRLAIDGDWLDGSCEDRLFSIDVRRGSLKRFKLSGAQVNRPESLVHGPDHTLYVLDSGAVTAFRVER